MKCKLKWPALVVFFGCTIGVALATPVPVDFSAVQTQPQTSFPGDPGYANQWIVVTNTPGYNAPKWLDNSWLTVDSSALGGLDKRLWLTITFVDEVDSLPFTPYIVAGASAASPQMTIDSHTVTWEWYISPSPSWQDIGFVDGALTRTFPVSTFDFDGDGTRDIQQIEVASQVIPEPLTLFLFGAGSGVLLLCRKHRRH